MSVWKDSVEIDTDNYPELEGMTQDEVLDYVISNGNNMDSTDDEFGNLYEELMGQDEIHEREKNYQLEIILDDE